VGDILPTESVPRKHDEAKGIDVIGNPTGSNAGFGGLKRFFKGFQDFTRDIGEFYA
jgi:hypothetical protein